MNAPHEDEFLVPEPTWTARERWHATWFWWLVPASGFGLFIWNALMARTVVSWLLLVWAACYLVHTWLLTNTFMWLHKFADNTIAVIAKVETRRWRT